MVIDDKGGEMDKDMKLSLDMWWQRGWENANMDINKEGATIEE
jgi:hypothetical protein